MSFCDEVRSEAERRTEPPLRKSAVVAVLRNPLTGTYVESLSPLALACGGRQGNFRHRCVAPDKPVSYGKAAGIGLAGEQDAATPC